MKVAVILLAVALLITGVLYYRQGDHARNVSEQLAAASNQVVAAQTELLSVKTQMTDRVKEMESALNAAKTEKVDAETRVGQLQERVRIVEQDLQDEKNKLTSVEDQRTQVVTQLTSVSNELTNVRGQLGDLQRTHAATEAELRVLRERETTLEMEKASLERQLNDLDALKAQIRIVKRQLWEKHIEEWKRQDQEAGLNGNKGLLFKNGQWQTGVKPAS